MDTQQLNLFVTLADTLHFGQTSNLLHMSPSAVSRAVQRIEEEVGEPLLLRDSRSVSLTAAGRRFQEYAETTLAGWKDFNEGLREDADHLAGEVSIYCSVTAVYSVLANVLGPFRRRFPDIDIMLHTGDQADAIDHLNSGSEEVAVTARPDRLSGSLSFQTLTHSPLVFIYPAAQCAVSRLVRQSIEEARSPDWAQLPFIISERGQARVQLDRWFAERKIAAKLYAQVSGHEGIVSMVALGFGIGVVPELVLDYSPLQRKVRVLDVQPPLTPFAIGLCTRKVSRGNPLVQAFLSCAAEVYRPEH